MNIVLTWAFLPLLFAVAYRFFFAEASQIPWYHFQYMSTFELYLYTVCIVLGLVSVWHNFVRDRCPQCRAVNPEFLGEREIDRFVGSKKVHGKDGQGRTTTHHVSTTFARLEYHYSCSSSDCRAKWHTLVKREVT